MTLHKLMKFVEDTHVEKAESNLRDRKSVV